MVRVGVLATIATVASAGKVPTKRLSNGVEMPMVVAGTFKYNSSEAEASIDRAIQAGFTGIDCAYDYYNQDGVARALKRHFDAGLKREEFFIETKVPGCGFDDINTTDCYGETTRALYADLDQLQLDYLDVVIVHMPPTPTVRYQACGQDESELICKRIQDQWRAMTAFYKAGKARAIGVSNYCPDCFDCLEGAEIYPHVNQVQMQVGWGPDPRGILEYSEPLGVTTQGYHSLGTDGVDAEVLHGNLTNGIAKMHGVSSAQVALKYLVDNGVPLAVESSNVDHLRSNLDLWSWKFTKKEKEALDSWITSTSPLGVHPSWACDSWLYPDPSIPPSNIVA